MYKTTWEPPYELTELITYEAMAKSFPEEFGNMYVCESSLKALGFKAEGSSWVRDDIPKLKVRVLGSKICLVLGDKTFVYENLKNERFAEIILRYGG